MGDHLLSVLCALFVSLVFITVVGHGIWVVVAALYRAATGAPPQESAGKPCPQCGGRSTVHGGRCVACGAVPALTPGASQRDELRGTARQLWRLLQQGRITQQQFDDLMVHVRADLTRHGVVPPAEVVEAQVVDEPFAPIAGTKPGPGEASQTPRPLEPRVPERRVAPSFVPTTARQEPRPPLLATPPAPPQPVFVEPPQPARSWADMLQSFMEESNVRWGEIIAGLMIVISAVGLVFSLRATLESIPYFPAILFTVFTVAFHGAGLYTLRRWKLEAVSRTILIISLLLVPLTFSAAVVMSGSGDEQRALTDPLFLLAVTIGTVVFAWVSWSASRELVGEGQWRLAIGVLGCSLSQVFIQRATLAGAGFWGVNGVAAIPLACFLVATVGQLARGRLWPQLSRKRAHQTFLILGIASFAFLAPLALLLVRAEPRWLVASWLSPLLSLAAATVLALGLLIHRRATARDLATVQTAGTAVLICGGLLMLLLVVLAWPEPELLCAVGIVNGVLLVGLAIISRLPLLHAPAIACAALAAVMGLHLAQGRFADREDLPLQVIEASLMARTSLVLTLLAAAAGVLGLWQRREKREEWLVYVGGAGVLAALSIAIAAVAGFIPIRGWQQDADLAGPLLVFYALAFIAAGPLTPWPAAAGAGSFLLWGGLVQLFRFNATIRGALESQGLLPDRPVLVATLVHGLATALTAAIATGREMLAPREDYRRFEHTPRGEQLVLPLAAGAVISLVLVVPLLLWRWHDGFVGHAGCALAAAAAWAAVALAMRWKGAVSAMQAMLALAAALVVAGGWMRVEDRAWALSPGHVQGQLVLLAYGAVVWALVRRLSSRHNLARDLLHARWPAVDQMLLVLATVVLPLWLLLASVPALGWELGFDTATAGQKPVHPLHSLDGRGWLVLAAVLAAIGVSLWERVSAAALVSLGVASFAAVWVAAQFWHETSAVASAARWAAGIYAVVWALPFIFREEVRGAAKRLVWLRWEKLPRQLAPWFCAQPLVLGGLTVLVLTIIAVVQNASGVRLRGPAPPSIFDAMGPTAAYAAPLLAIVAVLLAYAVRQREAGFAMGGSVVFQLAVNLAFILHVTLSEQAVPTEIRAIEWLQWNAAAAGVYALVWLGLSRWIMPHGIPHAPREEVHLAERDAYYGWAQTMLTLQVLAGGLLTIALVGWAVFAVVENPRVPSGEAAQLGRWLSYLAAAVVIAAIGWHLRGRVRTGWGDIGVWLAFALVAFVACSLDERDSARVWLAYHTLSAGWLAIGLAATTLIVLTSIWSPVEPSPRPLVGAWVPHHLSAAAIAGAVAFLAIRGAVPDPGEPWWSLAASLGSLLIATVLGLVRRSQPYAYASAALAGLSAVLLLVAPSVAALLPQAFGSPPLAVVDVAAVAVLLAVSLWLAAEVRFQSQRAESLDHRFIGPRIHAVALVGWVAILLPWQLFLLVPLDWIATVGAKVAVVTDVVLLGVLLAATLWDRRAWWSLPALFAWGAAAWTLVVNLLSERFGLATGERYALLGLAAALHLALAGQLWSYGANLSVLGTRLGVSDPIGGLKRAESWLPPVTLAIAAGVCIGQLFFALNLARPEFRVAAALSPAIAAWGVLCLAQEKRRDALQLTSLLMAGLAAVYLGWAQLHPQEPVPGWGLTRAFRLLMVLSALTFVYGLALPRWLLTAGTWNSSVRKAGHIAGAAAIAAFLAVLVLEVMLFRPGVDAPIDGVQIGAIAVVLLALIAGLLSLALLPGRDPLALSETGRQWYVYAAEATAALLFAHLYICRPTWFDGILRPYWPLIIMGIAFAGVGLSELCHRFRIRVLAEPLERTGGLLPLLPVLTAWTAYAQTDYSLVLLVVGILYLVLSVTRKSWASLIAAALAGNGALWVLLHKQDMDITQNPQLWLIPPALSVLAAAQLNRNRLPPPTVAAIRYLATIVIYLSSTSEIFIRGVGDSLWPPMILAALSVAGALLGIMLRIRAFLYLGTSFTVLALGTMVAHAAQAIDHVWPWWAFGIGLGIALLVLFGVFEKKRPEVLALIGRLRHWEQ